jgi:hypothetical protein
VTASREELLGEGPLTAAVAALAERNRHHFEGMSDAERGQAVAHWRDLAVSVLTAAAAAIDPSDHGPQEAAEGPYPGRAVVVFEDVGPDNQIAVHASFFPQLEDLGNGEVGGTPAQATAIELLQTMAENADGEPPPGD